jgi:hypothetical protein
MGKRAARARLGLHRETFRNLTGRELADIAGGGWVASKDVLTMDSVNCDPDTCPKSNAWTAQPGVDAVCHA